MSFTRAVGRALVATGLLLSTTLACGESDHPPAPGPPATSGAGGSRPAPGAGGGPDGATETCAGDLVEAQPLPLDVYVMLDVSGSMLAPTESDPDTSKWQAVSAALAGFILDSASDGMGMGLQVFPIRHPDAPLTCTADSQCGSQFGPCLNRACWPLIDGELSLCLDASNCGVGQECMIYGECANDPSYLCDPAREEQCIGELGACSLPKSPCLAAADCRAATYATPAAAIDQLPEARAALLEALTSATPDPDGGTPTGPALQGALDQAATWAEAHPDRQVVAVLATDGVPTLCTPVAPDAVADVARAGLAATPSIATFVIGVLGPTDFDAPANLDVIARAGGSEDAFIVDTEGDVTLQFRDALERIRAARLSCDLLVPEAETGKRVDYGEVNVVFDDGDERSTLGYARDASGCDADPKIGGWYFDVDPDGGGVPRHILVCPSACQDFERADAGSVQIKLGCRRREVK